MSEVASHRFTVKILIGMFVGVLVGLAVKWIPMSDAARHVISENILQLGGDLFIRLIQLLVVPIVLFSLICGSSSLGDLKKFGRIGGKTFSLYIVTTALAITLALVIASLFKVGGGLSLTASNEFVMKKPPGFLSVIRDLVPKNPFKALAQGNMLQVIVFAVLFGVALASLGDKVKKVSQMLHSINEIFIKLILMIMHLAPYGVFFLLAALFSKIGFSAIGHLVGYFLCVLLVLALQLFVVYSLIMLILSRLNPKVFYKKMYSTLLFAFSISSSNASIPIVLKTVEESLGVKNRIASFVIPLGATINMDGTAIMQGVATVFVAHAYNIDIGITGYLTVIIMATLASIGTAGVPSVGLLTLALVFEQVGLPVSGIGLIIGIDRLLDMARTAVNVSGDAMIATVVAKSEKAFDEDVFRS